MKTFHLRGSHASGGKQLVISLPMRWARSLWPGMLVKGIVRLEHCMRRSGESAHNPRCFTFFGIFKSHV